jgi:endonuclease/exonuclease/phosphatase (EEP) superfamily protein YafD
VTGWRRWLRRLVVALALLYPAALLGTVFMMRAMGESWWFARLTLYLPRLLFLLPLPFLTLALLLVRARRYLFSQVVAFGIVLFPLMGFVPPWFHTPTPGLPTLRVVSYNVNSGYWGWEKVLGQIDELHPDVVLIQEVVGDARWGVETMKKRYPVVENSTQFIIASRYPIKETIDPERLPLEGRQRSPRFMRHLIETPLGPIAFYNIHPISPRHGLWALRTGGLKKGLLTGSLLRGETARLLQADGQLRDLQVEAIAQRASQEKVPVVIGGDTNLPDLSPALGYLSRFHDGFRAAGWGFGYTFPVGRTRWMRLDRLFASPQLRFVGFAVGRHDWASDHSCVVADLQVQGP